MVVSRIVAREQIFQTRLADHPVGFALIVALESVVAPQGSGEISPSLHHKKGKKHGKK